MCWCVLQYVGVWHCVLQYVGLRSNALVCALMCCRLHSADNTTTNNAAPLSGRVGGGAVPHPEEWVRREFEGSLKDTPLNSTLQWASINLSQSLLYCLH